MIDFLYTKRRKKMVYHINKSIIEEEDSRGKELKACSISRQNLTIMSNSTAKKLNIPDPKDPPCQLTCLRQLIALSLTPSISSLNMSTRKSRERVANSRLWVHNRPMDSTAAARTSMYSSSSEWTNAPQAPAPINTTFGKRKHKPSSHS